MTDTLASAASQGRLRTRFGDRSSGAIWSPVLGVVVLLGIWTYGGWAGWADGMVITPVAAIEPIFGDSADVYLRATRATVWSATRGLLIGGGLAFLAALVATGVPALRRSIVRLAAIANAAPWVAVAPCLLIVLGRDRGPVAVAAIAVFFFVFIATTVGLTSAPAGAHDVATALGSSRLRLIWSVQLPASWPSVADGLKLAAPAAMAGAVFGEWYGAERGLGVLLITAMQGARPDRLWAASLLSALCGLIAYGTLAALRSAASRRYGSAIGQSAPDGLYGRSGLRAVATETAAIGVLVAGLVSIWWLWIEANDISPIVVPRPAAVLSDVLDHPEEYVDATLRTAWTAAIALTVGTAIGLGAALAASRFEVLAGITVPFVVVLSATPLVALFPLFARVLGYNPTTVWALASVLVFYPVFVFTRSGLSAASSSALDVVDALGGSRGVRFRRVILPASLPHMVSGFRIAAGSAVIAAVVGESLIGREGLGVEFAYAYRLLELPRAFGAAVAVIVLSVVVFAALGSVERRVHARWT